MKSAGFPFIVGASLHVGTFQGGMSKTGTLGRNTTMFKKTGIAALGLALMASTTYAADIKIGFVTTHDAIKIFVRAKSFH